jgi:hypothetical protein
MQTIQLNLRQNQEPFSIDFDKVEMWVLCSITRIMDIEDFEKPLIIEVDYKLYMEVRGFVSSNHWMVNMDNSDPEILHIKLNGFELIFKIKTKSCK